MAKITILFAVANTNPKTLLKLEEEVRDTEEEILRSTMGRSLQLVPKLAVRAEDLPRHLQEQKPQILHFTAHGEFNPRTRVSLLWLCSKNESNVERVDAEEIGGWLKRTKTVRLVIFNVCYSWELARKLVEDEDSGVDVCIGTNKEIRSAVARNYAATLYQQIGFGASLQDAHAIAVSAAMRVLPDALEDELPQLCSRRGCNPAAIRLVKPPAWRFWILAGMLLLLLTLLLGAVAGWLSSYYLRDVLREPYMDSEIKIVPHLADSELLKPPPLQPWSIRDADKDLMDQWLQWTLWRPRVLTHEQYLLVRSTSPFSRSYQTLTCHLEVRDTIEIGDMAAFLVSDVGLEAYRPIYRQMKHSFVPGKQNRGELLIENPNKGEILLLLMRVRSEKGELMELTADKYQVTLKKVSP